MGRWRAPLAALLAGALAGCGGATDEPARWLPPVATPAASTSPVPSEVTLAFGGDVHFVDEDEGVPNRTGALLDRPETAFGPVAEVFQAADLAMINLETAVTTGGTPEPKAFHFRAPPAAYDAVAAAGIDVVSLANNHALDYGRQGLADTLAHAEAAGVPAVGAGADAAAAYAPWITEVHGVRIAFLGVSQIHELWESWRAGADRPGIAYALDTTRALAAVRDAADAADLVVLNVHWGLELSGHRCPTEEMTGFADEAADAGADLIVGSHAHHLLGDGWLGETFVQYGLGNFLWWRDDSFSNDTGVLWATIRDGELAQAEFRPAVISRETGQPIPATGGEADRLSADYADLRDCTGLADARDAG